MKEVFKCVACGGIFPIGQHEVVALDEYHPSRNEFIPKQVLACSNCAVRYWHEHEEPEERHEAIQRDVDRIEDL